MGRFSPSQVYPKQEGEAGPFPPGHRSLDSAPGCWGKCQRIDLRHVWGGGDGELADTNGGGRSLADTNGAAWASAACEPGSSCGGATSICATSIYHFPVPVG